MPEPLIDWVEERRLNCLRIARAKTGAEKIGWLEDADYFYRIGCALVRLDMLRAAPAAVKIERNRCEVEGRTNEKTDPQKTDGGPAAPPVHQDASAGEGRAVPQKAAGAGGGSAP
jgi:hypothetical protein